MNRATVTSTVTHGNINRSATVTSTVSHGKLNRWESGNLNRESTAELTVQVVSQIVFEPFRLFLQLAAQLDYQLVGGVPPHTSVWVGVSVAEQHTKTSKGFRNLAC